MRPDVALLPLPPGGGLLPQWQRYLRQASEAELKALVQAVRGHTLTWEMAAQGLGVITGYYNLLAEVERQGQQQREDS